MKQILLTGGSGFIGRNILESFLSKKYFIIAPRHSELDLTNEDQVRAFFRDHPIDYIIHSAGKAGHRAAVDTSNLFMNNSRMFFNLARNSQYWKKLLIIGSGAIYDMRYYQPKMKEEYFDTHVPVDEHGYTKYLCGKYIEAVDNIIDLRVFGIFGKYEEYQIRFISNLICKAIFDLPLSMKQNRKFDYLYINDLIPILDHFMEHSCKHKAYNITPDKSVDLLDLAQKINIISGKNLPITVQNEGYGLDYSGDNSRLRTEIHNLQFTGIDHAINELYSWYLKHISQLNRELLVVDK